MKDGLPLTYWVYRGVWSGLHLALVVLALVLLLVWAFTDSQGLEALTAWRDGIESARRGLSSLLPYPWD
ncbi:MAG: hypothetical protein LBJ62_10570 [Bifidobacteriaceae bacterium]|jgi:hypothetical protein|nr:hypothetical protein [Bifidobacteriaceae bacterium]